MDIGNSTDPTSTGSTDRSTDGGGTGRRGVAAGVAAGLLGGVAAGLVFGVPGFTNAATDDVEEPAVAGLVEQVDDTDPAAPADDFESGRQLRGVLQELVDDGTLTAEEADTVAAHVAEHRAEHRGERGEHRGDRTGPGGFGSRAGGVMSEAVTDLLGLTPTELREQLRDGATLGDIAEAQDVGTDALVDEIVGEVAERIAQGVENGRLDRAEADEKLAEVEARVADMVDNGHPRRGQD